MLGDRTQIFLDSCPKPLPKKNVKNICSFTGGPVVKNPPASAGDMGSIPGPGRFHMHEAAKSVCQNY